MNVLIVGLGRTGSYLAAALAESGRHNITAVEIDEDRAKAFPETERVRVIWNDGCEPTVLEEAGVHSADLVVATAGHDEDNLVVAQLARMHFNVSRVIGRVNNPNNQWLYSKDWGVDVAVSPMDIITKVIEEEMSLGDLITLLKLKQGEVALTEIKLTDASASTGQKVAQLSLPEGALLVTVMRGKEVIFPSGETVLQAGDDVLAITSVAKEEELMRVLS